jgi:hypothetical protein
MAVFGGRTGEIDDLVLAHVLLAGVPLFIVIVDVDGKFLRWRS